MKLESAKWWLHLTWGDSWYLTVYFNPKVWSWFDFHRNCPCCKFWLLLGPFELNRVWTDADDYPFDEDDDAA